MSLLEALTILEDGLPKKHEKGKLRFAVFGAAALRTDFSAGPFDSAAMSTIAISRVIHSTLTRRGRSAHAPQDEPDERMGKKRLPPTYTRMTWNGKESKHRSQG